MLTRSLKLWIVLAVLFAVLVPAHAASVDLHAMQFPEKRTVPMMFEATEIAPAARVDADVTYRNGQAQIDLDFSGMKPAILFGGDVTCFVVWAVTRDGQAENLGELMTRKASGRLSFSTGKKNFALLVTAESFFLSNQPSSLVAFKNRPMTFEGIKPAQFVFDALAEAPRHSMDAIGHIRWDSKVPIELLQARKAFELAGRNEAQSHAGEIYTEAGNALRIANEIARTTSKGRELLDYSRRAVQLSNEALNISMKRIEAERAERRFAERRAETEALEQRAREAEETARMARRLAEEVHAGKERMQAETAAMREEKTRLESSMIVLHQEKANLEGEAARLRQAQETLERNAETLRAEKLELEQGAERLREEKLAMAQEAQRLQQERDALSGRLQSALSHVADTQDTARGFVINLPDILFDLNESTLKSEAQLVLAKLAGILLIMPGQRAVIEGHTDSTGSAEYNLDLSQRRAEAVRRFLQTQGLDSTRLDALGFGMDQPVADNDSPDGRKKNRRVEIVISNETDAVAAR